MESYQKPFTFDRVVRLIITLAVITAAILLINRLKGVLLPFLVAWLIAYMINPLVEWNARIMRLRKRIVAILLSLLEITVCLTLIGILIIPMIINETRHLYQLAAIYVTSSNQIPLLPDGLQSFVKQHITLEDIGALLSREQWIELGRNALKQAYNVLSSSVHGIITLISWGIVFLYVFFILLDYDRIIQGFSRLIPQRYRKPIFSICTDVKESMNRYFRGQALVASIVGVLHCIGFLIVGLPMAIPLGLLVGILNMIPYMQILSYIPAILLCVIGAADTGSNFWILLTCAFAVYAVVQIIQDGFLVPRIMGNVTGLNPAIILLSLAIWGSLMGLIGMIIALPLTSLLLSYYHKYIVPSEQPEKNSDTNIKKQDS